MTSMILKAVTRAVVLFSLLCASTPTSDAQDVIKRGAGVWSFPGGDRCLNDLKVPWFYNWGVQPPTKDRSVVEFVPMIWSQKDATDSALETARRNGKVLLGFDEPDEGHQANMSVELALQLWPKLQNTGRRLGSPAPAGRADAPDGWFARFMKGVSGQHLRVDFICLHYYDQAYDDPVGATQRLKRYIESVHKLYPDKPIWLTEFGMSNWKEAATSEQLQAFMKQALPVLDQISYLERYAWFAVPPDSSGDGGALSHSNLSENDGTLTPLGIIYRDSP